MKKLTKSPASNAFLSKTSKAVQKSAAKALDNTPVDIRPAKMIESEPRYDVQNVVNTELGKLLPMKYKNDAGKEVTVKAEDLHISPGQSIGLPDDNYGYRTRGANVLKEVETKKDPTGVNNPKSGNISYK